MKTQEGEKIRGIEIGEPEGTQVSPQEKPEEEKVEIGKDD